LSNRAGIKLQQIPFKGGAPAVMATVAGQTHLTLMSPLVSAAQIEAGKLRPIAAGGQKREGKFPDVPTIIESGFPGLLATQWIGLLVKAGTPADIVKRLNTAVNDALRQPDVKDKLAAQGVSTVGGKTEEFKTLIAKDVKDWKEAAKIADIHPK
jgi:tripartite-type tricarboxylate transporter receptor subunit TctC